MAITIPKDDAEVFYCSNEADHNVTNWLAYIMDFDYYIENGLLTDEMFQKIAKFQRTAIDKYTAVIQANKQLSEKTVELGKLIGVVNYGKLDVDKVIDSGYVILDLNDPPFVYRTDDDKKKQEKFKVIANDTYDYNGDPVINFEKQYPSIVYAIKKDTTNNVEWKKIYVRDVTWKEDGTKEGEPDYDKTWPLNITLNIPSSKSDLNVSEYDFYLFEINNANGYIGALEAVEEAALKTLEEQTTIVTSRHPVFFDMSTTAAEAAQYGYCWKWDSDNSMLYYYSAAAGTGGWKAVHFARTTKEVTPAAIYEYRYECSTAKLLKLSGGTFVAVTSDSLKKEVENFSVVYMICMQHQRINNGVCKNNIYTVGSAGLPVGNYYYDSGYDYYYLFSTKTRLTEGATINYMIGDEVDSGWIVIKNVNNPAEDDSILAKAYRFDSVSKSENDWDSRYLNHYSYTVNGVTTEYSRAGEWYNVNDPNYNYMLTVSGATYNYAGAQQYVGSLEKGNYYVETSNGVYLFTTTVDYPHRTRMYFNEDHRVIRISVPNITQDTIISSSNIIYLPRGSTGLSSSYTIEYNNNVIYAANVKYTRLYPISHVVDGLYETHGLKEYMSTFMKYTTDVYENLKAFVDAAQEEISRYEQEMKDAIGDLYREGWWQNTNYVDGDEQKLYDDAIENLVEISKPQETYQVAFIDNYMSKGIPDSISLEHNIYPYQNPSIMTGAHIIDIETGINKWAFIDRITNNYNVPGQTSITLNTSLKTIAQHSFTDVMATIAEVANNYKGTASKVNKIIDQIETK